jgi:KDO2-lipid IV(A) lauroyltransferase
VSVKGLARRARFGVESLLVSAAARAVRNEPMAVVRARGEALGRFVHRIAGSRRRIALDNLQQAMPELSAVERERIVRGMFEHFGRMLLELVRFETLSPGDIRSLMEVDGEEHVLRAYEAGKGMIFVGGHIGYWEQQGIAHAVSWRPISIMVRPLDNPRLHDLLERIRTGTGNAVIYRQGSIRKVLRALASNRGVAILIDQHLHTSDAIQVDFFGRSAATTSVVGSLVHRTGATVLPVFGLPLPGGRYRFVYESPIAPPQDDSPEAIREFTQRCTDVIETYVRRHPDMWMWMHRRWRAIPAGAPGDEGLARETALTNAGRSPSASGGPGDA